MKRRLIYGFFLLLFLPVIGVAQITRYGIIQNISCKKDTAQQYAIYTPSSYDDKKNRPLLIFFDPAGRGDLPVTMYHNLADDHDIIMAGSYNSRNFNGKSSAESFIAVYNDIVNQYNIDPAMVWVAGFSGGARFASSIAMVYPEIKGVIACGAGFASDEELTVGNIVAYAAVVGESDMNYGELLENSHYLDAKKINNLLLTFNGGHDWPPADRFGLALDWLIGKEKDVYNINVNIPFLKSVYNKLDSGFLYTAWMDVQQLIKIPAYKKIADSLLMEIESRNEFTTDRENFIRVMTEEQNCMNDFSLAFSKMVYQKEMDEKKNWMQKAGFIAEMKKDTRDYRRMAGERCFDHYTRSCIEYYFRFVNTGDNKIAFNAAEILSFLNLQNPEPFFLMARAEAAEGNRKHCEKLLKEAVKKGFEPGRILQDSLLLEVISAEEMKKYLE